MNITLKDIEMENPVVEYVPVCSFSHRKILKFIFFKRLQTYLYSSALVLAAISIFLRMGFLLKLSLMVVSVITHIVIYSYLEFFQDYHDAHDDE